MSKLNDLPISLLQFYVTAPYPCSYIDGKLARSQVATPSHAINSNIYSNLVNQGFRRSGAFTYRPLCDSCTSCVPVRISVDEFSTSKSQRRVWKKHKDLSAKITSLQFKAEHYRLYLKYQSSRHSGGGMDQDSQEQYRHFLLQSNVRTQLIEFRDDGLLRMVSIVDKLNDGFSSVYTFFDPDITRSSFGTYSILWQIQHCQNLKLPFLYLGYWIKESEKMAYKNNFQPIEKLIDNMWQTSD